MGDRRKRCFVQDARPLAPVQHKSFENHARSHRSNGFEDFSSATLRGEAQLTTHRRFW